MKILNAKQSMDIPDGVECKVKARVVTIKGPRGTLVRSFRHLAIDIYMEGPTKLTVSNFPMFLPNFSMWHQLFLEIATYSWSALKDVFESIDIDSITLLCLFLARHLKHG